MNVREYITDILYRVEKENAYASLLMRRENSLSREDMAFASQVIYGTLRNMTLLEYQWKPLAKQRVRPRTRCILNMSVYQLLFLDHTPAYAVIHEAVELAGKHEGKFVNAVLRAVEKEGLRQPEGNDLKSVSIRTSHPLWMLELWKAHYGEERAVKIAEAQQEIKPTYGRINTLKITKEKLADDPHYRFLSDTSFQYEGPLQNTDAFRKGEVVVQDINAQQPAKYLDVREGQRVLDVCAAPGTKTQQISALMKNTGSVTACDLYEKRTDLIRTMMDRCGSVNVTTAAKDMTKPDQFEKESFDRILIDAPCSGMGDLSHKPEIRWHLKPENIDAICLTQKGLLEACAPYLRKNGILVYSTCTLDRKENERRTEGFLKAHPDFECLQEKTLFPDETGGDGFYVAQLHKKG